MGVGVRGLDGFAHLGGGGGMRGPRNWALAMVRGVAPYFTH